MDTTYVKRSFAFKRNTTQEKIRSDWKFKTDPMTQSKSKMKERFMGVGYASHWKIDNSPRGSLAPSPTSAICKKRSSHFSPINTQRQQEIYKRMYEELVGKTESEIVEKRYRRVLNRRSIPISDLVVNSSANTSH